MKSLSLLFLSLFTATALFAQEDIRVLDLTNAHSTLTFDEKTGAWSDTYNDNEFTIESQCFSFLKGSMGSYSTWWGFTASNSADNSFRSNFTTYQFSNMAKGGIVLNEDGTIKKDENGAPVVDPKVPYIVSYASPLFAKHPASIYFNEDKLFEPVGVYVNLNSYTFYTLMTGDSFCRSFNNGDKLTLYIHGVGADDSDKVVEFNLAYVENGMLCASRGWTYVDLSSLGAVNEIWFTMSSTDKGAYGDNTPLYFCLDKLMVRAAKSGSVATVENDCTIRYDRQSETVYIAGSEFTAVYNAMGQLVKSSMESSFRIDDLDSGVYIVKSGSKSLKIAK